MLKHILKLILFKKKWWKKNPYNFTSARNIFDINNVRVGNYTYGGLYVLNDIAESYLVIGSYCSIADKVSFILGNDHRLKDISTYPFKQMLI